MPHFRQKQKLHKCSPVLHYLRRFLFNVGSYDRHFKRIFDIVITIWKAVYIKNEKVSILMTQVWAKLLHDSHCYEKSTFRFID